MNICPAPEGMLLYSGNSLPMNTAHYCGFGGTSGVYSCGSRPGLYGEKNWQFYDLSEDCLTDLELVSVRWRMGLFPVSVSKSQ